LRKYFNYLMGYTGVKNANVDLAEMGLGDVKAYWNLSPAALVEKTILNGQGKLTSSGALSIDTGEFTGRSPQDRFIVQDDITRDNVDWGNINRPFDPDKFDNLYDKVVAHLNKKNEIYIRDCSACANLDYRLKIRVFTENPWQNLFAYNMFLRPTDSEKKSFEPDWNILAAPSFTADPKTDGTRQHNFAIINFTKKCIIIGGTAYTGEIKKGIFSVLNYILPTERGVFPMHCSANVGKKSDTALFFGLSGTGKTTLSTDPQRKLIGDDEHGWSSGSVFNFEGGCYAKTIDLSESKEPQIYSAIKFGALLENVGFSDDTNREVDYSDGSKTENTRVSYPIDFINNIVFNSRGDLPENIFFLTCDAFGVLPPISKLTKGQAMFHFLAGYTAKIAGTEAGITDPEATFSSCFGLPFLPLHPTKYAELLGKKLEVPGKRNNKSINVWLINTGWTGGPFGKGNRIELAYTRALISAALNGALDEVNYKTEPVFGLSVPVRCPDVPNAMLYPRDTWPNENEYDVTANKLANLFIKKFDAYKDFANAEILEALPVPQ
jgi:phosphoenolpyruvate carboxykinase (ATP)